jgi:hypothetical protein
MKHIKNFKLFEDDLPTFSDPFYGNDLFKIRYRQLGALDNKKAPDAQTPRGTDALDQFQIGDHITGEGVIDGEEHSGEVITVDKDKETLEIEENGEVIKIRPGTAKFQIDGEVGQSKQGEVEPTGTAQDDYTQAGNTFTPFSYESKHIKSFNDLSEEAHKTDKEPEAYINISHPQVDGCYNKATKTFTFEIAELEHSEAGVGNFFKTKGLVLYNPKTKMSITMNLVKTDKDGSGEDTYGWHFEGDGFKAHIIND